MGLFVLDAEGKKLLNKQSEKPGGGVKRVPGRTQQGNEKWTEIKMICMC